MNKKIVQIQQSTKTTLGPFNGVHNKLRMRFKWYYRWHLWRGSNWVHLATLVFFMVGLSLSIVSFGFLSYKTVVPTPALATTSYIVSGAGSNGWDGTYTLVGNDDNGNPYYVYHNPGAVVSSAGDTSFNGTYSYAGNDSNGNPYYVYHGGSGDRFLGRSGDYWFLTSADHHTDGNWGADEPPSPAYGIYNPYDITGAWFTIHGASPAPTVTGEVGNRWLAKMVSVGWEWLLTNTDSSSDGSWGGSYAYYGEPNTELPATPWHTADGNDPAPTVTEGSMSSSITISGTAYTDDTKSATINSCTNCVGLSINGGAKTLTSTDGSGVYSFANQTVAANNTITLYLTGGTYTGNLVTQAIDSSTNITGQELYANDVALSNQNAAPMTNTLLATANNCADCGSDIKFTDSAGAVTFTTGYKAWIVSAKEYKPGNTVTADALTIVGTFTPEGNSITLAGTGTPLVISGTFTAGTSTINYTGGTTATNITSTTYSNLYLNHASTTYTAAGDITASGVLTINAGTFDASSRTITLSGSGTPFVKTGTFTPSTSTVTYTGTSATNVTSTTYNNLTFNGTGTYTAAGDIIANATFTLTGGTFNASTRNITCVNMTANGSTTRVLQYGTGNTWTVSGNWDSSGTNQTETIGTSTVDLTGTGSVNTKNSGNDFYNLKCAHNGQTTSVNGAMTVANLLYVYSGGTFNNTVSTWLNKTSGDPIVNTGVTFTGAGLIVYWSNNSATVAGYNFGGMTIQYGSGSSTITYTLSSGVTTTGDIRVFNNFFGRVNTLDTAGFNLSCANLYAGYAGDSSNGGAILLRGGSHTVTGNLSRGTSTLATNAINFGTGSISVGGNINFTGITVTAGTGTQTVTMNGAAQQNITSYNGTSTQAFNNLTSTNASASGVTFADAATVNGTFADTTGSSKLTFHSGSTYNFNTVNIAGASSHLITLAPSSTTNWTFNPTAITAVSYVDVSRSTNSGTSFCANYSNDGLNNVGWHISAGATCAPTAPTNATIGNLGSTTFDTTWTDNSSDETGFKVYISTVPNATCSAATYPGSPDYTAAANAQTQAVSGKSINSQYCAKVIATNANGDSTASYSSPKYTLANVPNAPTVNATSTTSLTVIIDANNNPSATQFAIYNQTAGQYVQVNGTLGASAVWQTRLAWGGDSGIINTGLSVNVSYSYQVKARNGENTETALSSGASKYTLANAPTSAAIDSRTTTGINWSWNANSNPGTTNFYTSDSAGNSGWTTATTWNQSSLSINTNYTLIVKAKNGDGTETTTTSTSGYTLANQPSAPTVAGNYSTGDGYYEDVTINVNNNPAGTNYWLQYSTNGTDFSDPTGMAWQTGTTYKLVGLSANTQYWFKVKAKNGDNTDTAYSSAGADVTPPAAPTGLNSSNLCGTTASTSWTASVGADKYTFSYGTDAGATNLGTTANIVVTNKDLTGLTNLTTYYFKVEAISNANGTGAYSAIDNFTTGSCTAPVAPSDFNGTPATTQINWTWTDTANDETVWRVEDASHTNLSGALAVNSTGWNETLLSVNTVYTRHANVYNAYGSNDSNQVTKYTLANVPSVPAVSAVSSGIKIVVNQNSNPDANTRYAIYNQTAGKYVKRADGTLQDAEDWQLYADWGDTSGFVNIGLSPNISYTYQVKAENGDDVATAFSGTSSCYSPANVSSAPTVNATSTSSLTIIINANSNPSTTQYSIYNDTASKYVQANGTLGAGAVWQDRATWGGDSGIINTGLSPNTSYTYQIKVKNADNVETVLSAVTAQTTLSTISIDHIIVSPNSVSLYVSGTAQFNAVAYDNLNHLISGATFVWSIAHGGGAINDSGLFTAGLVAGTFSNTIQATSSGVSGYATVIISNQTPTSTPTPTLNQPSDLTAPQPKINLSAKAVVKTDVQFDGTGSTDNIGITKYTWNFGNGVTALGGKVTYAYNEMNRYKVTLTVEDGAGNIASTSQLIDIIPPTPKMTNVGTSHTEVTIEGDSYVGTENVITLHSQKEFTTTIQTTGDSKFKSSFNFAQTGLDYGNHKIVIYAQKKISETLTLVSDSVQYDALFNLDNNGDLQVKVNQLEAARKKFIYTIIGLSVALIILILVVVMILRKRAKRKNGINRFVLKQ